MVKFIFTLAVNALIQASLHSVDVAIIGSGCAGLSAAMVTSEYGYTTVVIEGSKKGGELNVETIVGNWPGKSTCKGHEIITTLEEQARSFGTTFVKGKVVSCDLNSSPFCLVLDTGETIQAKTVLIATGSKEKKPTILGFDEYLHKGIWTNADVYEHLKDFKESIKNEEIMIIGGGIDSMKKAVSAVRAGAKKVSIILRNQEFRLAPWRQNALAKLKEIEIIKESEIVAFEGNGKNLTQVILQSPHGKEVRLISNVLMAIGWNPQSDLFDPFVATDPNTGAILVDSLTQQTSALGVYAAGDVTTSHIFGQGAIAASDGMKAGYEIVTYLKKRSHEIK